MKIIHPELKWKLECEINTRTSCYV